MGLGNNQLGFLDLLNILNLGIQIYDVKMNKDEIETTIIQFKTMSEKQDSILSNQEEILKLLKEKENGTT